MNDAEKIKSGLDGLKQAIYAAGWAIAVAIYFHGCMSATTPAALHP